MAVIQICDLKLRTIIGINPWERANKQELVISIMLEYDAAKASKSDSLKDALDYASVAAKVTRIVETSRYQLLEKLAAKVLEGIMADKRILASAIRLDKPLAIPGAKCVSFELSASQ